MTSFTIDLPAEMYERLRAEAQRQGKAEQILAQELLEGQLLSVTQSAVPLYVQMLPRIRTLAATMNLDDLIVPGTAPREETRSWTEEDTEDDDAEAWEDVFRSIDANRSSSRKLFPDLEQPE